jgi:arsenite methyltransferase
MVVVTSEQRDVLFEAVRDMYTAVADRPDQEYHFPTGRRACEYVGYPADLLDRVPATAVESFAGVGYPFAADVIRAGDVVLDIGSGSGTDLIVAAILSGGGGRAIGLDMTEAMRRKAASNARAAGLDNVELIDGNA